MDQESWRRLVQSQNAAKPHSPSKSSAPDETQLASSIYDQKHTLDALHNAAATAYGQPQPIPRHNIQPYPPPHALNNSPHLQYPINARQNSPTLQNPIQANIVPVNVSYASPYDDHGTLATAATARVGVPDAPYILRYSPPPSPPDDYGFYNSSNLQSSIQPPNVQDYMQPPLLDDYLFGYPNSVTTAGSDHDGHWVKDYNAASYLSSLYDDRFTSDPISAPKVDEQDADHWSHDWNFLDRLRACNPPGYEPPIIAADGSMVPSTTAVPHSADRDKLIYDSLEQFLIGPEGNVVPPSAGNGLISPPNVAAPLIKDAPGRPSSSDPSRGPITEGPKAASVMPVPKLMLKPTLSARPAPMPPPKLTQTVGLTGSSDRAVLVSMTPSPSATRSPTLTAFQLLTERLREKKRRKLTPSSSMPEPAPNLAAPRNEDPKVATASPIVEGSTSTCPPGRAVQTPLPGAAPPSSEPNNGQPPPSPIVEASSSGQGQPFLLPQRRSGRPGN